VDQSAADLLPKVCIEILPPDREEPCASDATTCPCCRELRPASSMDEDGCGIRHSSSQPLFNISRSLPHLLPRQAFSFPIQVWNSGIKADCPVPPARRIWKQSWIRKVHETR
jgi:hypothetical protein